MLCTFIAAAAQGTPAQRIGKPSPASKSDTRGFLQQEIRSYLRIKRTSSFDPLLKTWETRYGSSPATAVRTLIGVASNTQLEDPERYVALMGAARLGGSPSAPLIAHLLKDRSWMIRNATLRALTALDHPPTSVQVLPLLKDPALVVRIEAVEAVRELRPQGATNALVNAALAPENYHAGKAQWVPQRALLALVEFEASDVAPRLAPLLDRSTDPAFQKLTIQALQKLKGRNPVAGNLPLQQQVTRWKTELAKTPAKATR